MSNALTEAQRASHDEPEKVTSKLRANAGQIIAGIITSFEMLVDCAALASVLTLQSSALGSIQRISVVTKGAVVMSGIFSLFVNQLFMNMFSKCEPYVVSLGWEAVPLFITLMRSVRKDVDAKNEGRELEDHLGPTITAYTAVVLSGLLAGVLMMGLAKARLVGLFSFVPEVMLCGMYACIGWQLFTLGFDLSTDGGAALYLDQPEQLHRLFEAAQWPLWLTGLLLGLALYAAMEYVPERYSSYTIPLYYLSCIVIFNAAFAAAGTSLAEAAELKWTVAAYETDHAWKQLWTSYFDSAFTSGQDDPRVMDVSNVTPRTASANSFSDFYAAKQPQPPPPPPPPSLMEGDGIDWAVIGANFFQIFMCALVGPVFNVAVDLSVLKSRTRASFDLNDEFFAAGSAQAAAALGVGYPAYLCVLDTLEHRTNGGSKRASTLVCVFFYLAFLLVHDLRAAGLHVSAPRAMSPASIKPRWPRYGRPASPAPRRPPCARHRHAVFRVIPFPMLGGLSFYIGIDEFWNSLGPGVFNKMPLSEYALLLLMLAVFIATGMNLMWPFAIGMGVSLVVLIAENASSSSILEEGHSGGTLRSDTCRSARDAARLEAMGEALQGSCYVLRFKGLIGFPQARIIANHIEQLAVEHLANSAQRRLRVFLFDFAHVDVLAPSAAMTLAAVFEALIEQSAGTVRVYVSGLCRARNPAVRRMLLQQTQEAVNVYSTHRAALGAMEDAALGLFWLEAILEARTAVNSALPPAAQSRRRAQGQLLRAALWAGSNRAVHAEAWAVLLFGMLGQWTAQRYTEGEELSSPPGAEAGSWLLLAGTVVVLEPPEPGRQRTRRHSSTERLVVGVLEEASQAFSKRRSRGGVLEEASATSGAGAQQVAERYRGLGLILHPSGLILDAAPPPATSMRAAGEVHALFISAANVAAMRGGGGASSLQVNEAARRAAIVLWELSVKALLNRSSGAPGAGALAAGTVSTPPHKGGGTSNSKSGL